MSVNIGFIGAGNMATAIIGGILKSGMMPPEQIGVFDVSEDAVGRHREQGLTVFGTVEELTAASRIVVLSVKPQIFPRVLPEVRPAMKPDKLLVSIAAGITAEYLQSEMGFPCKTVLVMPNTPLLLGKGSTALSRVEPATEAELEEVRQLFGAAGIAEVIRPDQMNEIIPVNGSSPAFLYQFAKTVVDEAEARGIDRETAHRLFCQAMIGSAEMMLHSGKSHQELIDMVCSPGGTTLAALEAMEQAGFAKSVQKGYDACVKRARELAK